jgi:hypothetical protein
LDKSFLAIRQQLWAETAGERKWAMLASALIEE